MKIDAIREMTQDELNSELTKQKNELFNLRFQHATGQLENPIQLREVRKDIARIKTVIRENEIKAQKA